MWAATAPLTIVLALAPSLPCLWAPTRWECGRMPAPLRLLSPAAREWRKRALVSLSPHSSAAGGLRAPQQILKKRYPYHVTCGGSGDRWNRVDGDACRVILIRRRCVPASSLRDPSPRLFLVMMAARRTGQRCSRCAVFAVAALLACILAGRTHAASTGRRYFRRCARSFESSLKRLCYFTVAAILAEALVGTNC